MDRYKVKVEPLMAVMAATLFKPTRPLASLSSTNLADRFTPEVVVVAKVVKVASVAKAARVAQAARAVLVVAVNTPLCNGKDSTETTLVAVVAFQTALILPAPVNGVVAGTAITTLPTPGVDWLAVTHKVRATTHLAALTATSALAFATTAERMSLPTPTVDPVDLAVAVVAAALAAAVVAVVMEAVDAATTKHVTTVPVAAAVVLVTADLVVPMALVALLAVLTLALVVLVAKVELVAKAVLVEQAAAAVTAVTGVRTETAVLTARLA